MPNYTFRNKITGEEWTDFYTISQREKYLNENPDVEQTILFATPLCDPTRIGITSKPDSGFRDVLKTIKKKYKGSTINTF